MLFLTFLKFFKKNQANYESAFVTHLNNVNEANIELLKFLSSKMKNFDLHFTNQQKASKTFSFLFSLGVPHTSEILKSKEISYLLNAARMPAKDTLFYLLKSKDWEESQINKAFSSLPV